MSPQPEDTDQQPALAAEVAAQATVNAQALVRGSVYATVLAGEHGRTASESEELVVGVRDGQVFIAADMDLDTTATTDGRNRPMRYRFRLPGEGSGRAAVRVRVSDLLKSIRGRGSDSAVETDLLVSIEKHDGAASLVVGSVAGGGRRACPAVKMVSEAEIVSLLAKAPDKSIGSLSADTILRAGISGSEGNGVLISPADGYVASISGSALNVSSFLKKDDGATPELTGEAPDFVMSSRLARAVGVLQEPVRELSRERVRDKVSRATAITRAAFVEACVQCTTNKGEALAAIYEFLGRPDVEKLDARSAKEESVVDKALVWAQALMENESAEVVSNVRETLLREGENSKFRPLTDGVAINQAHADLAVGYLSRCHSPTALKLLAGAAIGEVRISTSLSQGTPVGEAAVNEAGRRALGLVDELAERVEPGRVDSWWATAEKTMLDLGADREVVREVSARKSRRAAAGTSKQIVISEGIRSRWLSEEMAAAEGRMASENGRVVAGWESADGESLVISDEATESNPSSFPLHREAIKHILSDTTRGVEAEVRIHSEDLIRLSDLAVSMSERGQNGRAVMLLRWEAGAQEAVLAVTGVSRNVMTPEIAWMDEKELSMPRTAGRFPVETAETAGTLRAYALGGGSAQYMHLPIMALTKKPDKPVVAMVNALDMRSAALAAGSGDVRLRIGPDTVEIRGKETVQVVAKLGIEQIPEKARVVAHMAGATSLRPQSQVAVAIASAVRTSGVKLLERKTETEIGQRHAQHVMAVKATSDGARSISIKDAERRQWERELAEVSSLVEDFPQIGSAQIKALVNVEGSINGALKRILSAKTVARHIERTPAMSPLLELVGALKGRGFNPPPVAGEALDLFAVEAQGAREDERIEKTWKSFLEAARKVRRRLVLRQQDLELARGIHVPESEVVAKKEPVPAPKPIARDSFAQPARARRVR